MAKPPFGAPLRRHGLSPWTVLVVGLLVTAAAAAGLRASMLDAARLRFANASQRATAHISLLLARQVAMMRGASGLFIGAAPSGSVGGVVDARSFARFVASLDLPTTYPDVRSIAFARRVSAGDAAALVAERRAQGDARFAISPAGERSPMYPIVYLAPGEGDDRGRLGADLYADAPRREALERAIATGDPALSAPLRQDRDHRRGPEPDVAIYVPVYQFVGDDRQRGTPFGCLECEIDLDAFIPEAFGPTTGRLDVRIRDGESEIFRSGSEPERPLRHRDEIVAAGRAWEIETAAAIDPDGRVARLTGGVLVVGTALSALLCALTFRDMHAKAVALSMMERLLAAESKLRRLVEANVVGVVIGDADGRVEDANDAFLRLAAATREQLASGIDWRELTPPELRPLDREAVASLRRGETPRPYETELVRGDGRRVPILRCLALITPPDGIAAFVIDLTDLKDAQRRLADSERLFRTMADHAPVMIRTTDASGRGTYFNRPWLAFTGRTLDDMLGDGWLATIHPDDRGALMETRATALARREPFAVEHRLLDASGVWRWVLDQGVPLPGDAGSGIIGSCIDIDSRRRARDEAMRLSAELARSNADLGEFAGVASHDLQEPLRMIDRYSELVAQRYADRLDDTGRRFIGFIRDGAARMRALITDLLAYSRAGGAQEQERCDPDEICRCALANLRAAIEDCDAVVEVRPLAPVIGDRPQLIRLFQNLIGNAIKYRAPGRAPEVRVLMARAGADVEFAVSDNGIGIAAEHQARIFGVFQRLHTREEYPGTGIGLAVCRRIVERHGGRIWVESEPGRGATFRFTLPSA